MRFSYYKQSESKRVIKDGYYIEHLQAVYFYYKLRCIAHGCLIVFYGSLAKILNFVRQRDNYLTANHNEARITVLVVLV